MDLSDLRDIGQRESEAIVSPQIRVCTAANCLACKSEAIGQRLEEELAARGLASRIPVKRVGCMGLCSQGSLVRVSPDGPLYGKVTPDDAPSIIEAMAGLQSVPAQVIDTRMPFFARQTPIVLENCGVIEPERIEPYIAVDGYHALYTTLREMTPGEVVETITRSGLRGRGGAGYPTGLKWALVAKTAAERKFVVCNADEGDPGAYMDRSVLLSDPHRILEGMAIAGYAVGASQGYIYCRGEYQLAVDRLRTAIRQARTLGLLGTNIFDSPFDFKIDIRIGAGAFVCGEETALIASIEGRRGIPRTRPPYPAERGLWGYPTLINNVETLANVPSILRRGADWYASIGTEKSSGTKVFALAGKVLNTGLIEVPMGTPLQTIVEEMGGGSIGSAPLKAVQTGGASGGCVPASLFGTPVDYESLAAIGSIMGSGGMIVMDEDDNMVDVARYFMEFCMDESCGKCVPCRAGTAQLHAMLMQIRDGEAAEGDLDRLAALCKMVGRTSLCGLGQSAPNPVLSTLRYFRDDYLGFVRQAKPVRAKSGANGSSSNGSNGRVKEEAGHVG
jgi:bidirectional [NiFe] hydrogenase diaphorase subunit